MKKAAIVGGGPTRKLAPFDDPTWEIWGLGRRRWPRGVRITRWFEMHSVQQIRAYRGNPRTKMNLKVYLRFLRRLQVPVHMQEEYRWVPTSRKYPLDEALREFGRCFTSSVSYMIAYAILKKYDKIGLWGIDLDSEEEYVYQRPAVLYLLAVARARGIDVYLPPQYPLQIPDRPEPVYTEVLYGYDWDHPDAWWNQRHRWRKVRSRAPQSRSEADFDAGSDRTATLPPAERRIAARRRMKRRSWRRRRRHVRPGLRRRRAVAVRATLRRRSAARRRESYSRRKRRAARRR